MGAGRSDLLTVRIENRDLIMVVALAVKHEFVPAIAMCAGRHSSFSMNRGGGPGSDSPPDELSPIVVRAVFAAAVMISREQDGG